MPTILEGGCRVTTLREGTPRVVEGLRIWPLIGRATGAADISLRLLELAPGTSPAVDTPACDDVWYVLEGEATLLLNDRRHEIAPETGVYIAPRSRFSLTNRGPGALVLLSSRCPDPEGGEAPRTPAPSQASGGAPPLVRLADRAALPTGDRWYRVLVDDAVGSRQVTQFVGSIPPGRAPDHYHHYEEVLCILEGAGTMWAGRSHASIGPGSCVYLPRGQVHCVENTGRGPLRLLGVFYPAGSPAVRYEADGSAPLSGSAPRSGATAD